MTLLIRTLPRAFIAAVLLLLGAGTLLPAGDARSATAKGPFANLLGSWSGSGQVRYSDGTSERLSCRGSYTGNGFRMKMALRCYGSGNQVSINGQMRSTYGRVAGSWQENTSSLNGQVSGSASKGRVRLGISGGVSGTMSVSFDRTSQSVAVHTQGVSLQKVTMRLRRSR
ncbi:MAG: hypothetical protein ACR2OX_11550 [Methyloligellaceae bacterium]